MLLFINSLSFLFKCTIIQGEGTMSFFLFKNYIHDMTIKLHTYWVKRSFCLLTCLLFTIYRIFLNAKLELLYFLGSKITMTG